jgi:hypothetical protein
MIKSWQVSTSQRERTMKLTLTVPDNLASEFHLQSMDAEELAQIFERALRRRNGVQPAEFEGLTDVLEALAELPTPEEVLALRPSRELQQRIDILLEKNRKAGLSPEEEDWWEQYQYIEHLVRIAKAKAVMKLKAT